MDENVEKAVKATDDEFEVMLEGLAPLARAEYIELTAFPMGRQQWQTIRAHLLAREAEIAKCHRSVDHTQQWYAVRFERLKDLGKEKGCWSEMAAIMANGTVSVYETPTYAQQMNMLRHRAERAEALLRECDEVARKRGDRYGLCDAIDNTGQPYQSQFLADYLAHLSENSRG